MPELVRSAAQRRLDALRSEKPKYDWRRLARPSQIEPIGDWKVWLVLAGRGFGKTRSGAEWVRERVERGGARRVALVAPTAADVRDVMVEGESGILAISPPWFRPIYEPSKRRLTWPNGAVATTYSADEPERLRGPQHDLAWCDEVGAWRYPEAWDMLMFGLRLGSDPRCCVTTTPKPTKLIRNLANDPSTARTGGSTYENQANLAPTFFDQIKRYEGTELGRQEIHAELIDLSESAILKRHWWKIWPWEEPPEIDFIVLSFDTAYKDAEENDPTGFTAWGGFRQADGKAYNLILMDAWLERLLYPDLRERAQAEIKKHTSSGVRVIALIEDKSSGQALIQELNRAGVKVQPFNPGRDSKLMRAHTTSDMLKGGRIWCLGRSNRDGKTRNDKVPNSVAEMTIAECESFRGMDEDDDNLVDSCVQAWHYARHLGGVPLPSDPEREKRRKKQLNYYGISAAT